MHENGFARLSTSDGRRIFPGGAVNFRSYLDTIFVVLARAEILLDPFEDSRREDSVRMRRERRSVEEEEEEEEEEGIESGERREKQKRNTLHSINTNG